MANATILSRRRGVDGTCLLSPVALSLLLGAAGPRNSISSNNINHGEKQGLSQCRDDRKKRNAALFQ